MSMKHHYALIRHNDPKAFATEVNQAMVDGWVPLGGVAVTRETIAGSDAGDPPDEPLVYAQAMLRRGVNGVDIKT